MIMKIALSKPEQEVVFLKATLELVGSMVNFELMDLLGGDPDTQVQFKTSTHHRFFSIALVDFLSRTDPKAPVDRRSYLGALREICESPFFAVDGSIATLHKATQEFVEWLETEVEVEIWLASIGTQASVKLPRRLFLKMAGNLSKHNVLRAIGVAEEVQDVLEKAGHAISPEESLLVLSDFYERFHGDILHYHSSTIAEFLNNIRWGIFDYLQPEYRRSIVWERGDPAKYHYTPPAEIQNAYALDCYWSLLNEVRSPPYVRRFQVTRWLKLRY